MSGVAALLADKTGSTAIEYALLASLIAMGILGGLTATGTSLGGMVDGVLGKVAAVFG